MNQHAKDLADRIQAFNERVISVVEDLDDAQWHTRSPEEEWTVGVVARHIGAGHYGIVDLAKMIVAGQPLPEFTMDDITNWANQHAEKHPDCTKAEVLSILRENGKKLVDTVARWQDSELEKTAFLKTFDSDVSAAKIIEWVVFESAGGHLASIEKVLH